MDDINRNRSILNVVALLSLFLLMALMFSGCGGNGVQAGEGEEDLMPYATLLSYHNHEGYDEAVVYDPADTTRVLARYILIEESGSLPDTLPAGSQVLRIPLRSAIVDSQVYYSAVKETGGEEAIKGVMDARYFTDRDVARRLASGDITETGSVQTPNNEKIIALGPDGILLGYYQGMATTGIERLGFPVVKLADSGERTPLGRAEWIRFIGRLTGHGELADSIFRSVAESYTAAAQEARTAGRHPKVLVENIYNGVWYLPGGASYQARLIADAGGDYLWKNNKDNGSIGLTFEQVLERGRDADIWLLKLFGTELDRQTLLGMDPRYGAFRAVDKGGVYYCNTASRPLYEEFPFHPDRLLADYIEIFRGNDTTLRYFSPMRGI